MEEGDVRYCLNLKHGCMDCKPEMFELAMKNGPDIPNSLAHVGIRFGDHALGRMVNVTLDGNAFIGKMTEFQAGDLGFIVCYSNDHIDQLYPVLHKHNRDVTLLQGKSLTGVCSEIIPGTVRVEIQPDRLRELSMYESLIKTQSHVAVYRELLQGATGDSPRLSLKMKQVLEGILAAQSTSRLLRTGGGASLF